jgi:hypothetical protein
MASLSDEERRRVEGAARAGDATDTTALDRAASRERKLAGCGGSDEHLPPTDPRGDGHGSPRRARQGGRRRRRPAPPPARRRLDRLRTRCRRRGHRLLLLGLLIHRGGVFQSYLYAYVFWTGLALGCFALLMLQHLVGGAWGAIIQRPLEAGTRCCR